MTAAAVPWQPAGELPGLWSVFAGASHPSPLHEPVNLHATLPPPTDDFAPAVALRGLSHAQAEAAALACAELQRGPGRGFCLGDATGVGKGRIIAAIIAERTRRPADVALWVTTSATLHCDAARDLVAVAPDDEEGRRLASGESGGGAGGECRLLTYHDITAHAGLIADYISDGGRITLVFDEAHAASHRDSARANAVNRLQADFPDAAVVYSTATAASDVTRMRYMQRLGLWGPGSAMNCPTDAEFAATMTARGAAAQELLAIDMKRRGVYVSRSLATEHEHDGGPQLLRRALAPEESALYDASSERWHRWGCTDGYACRFWRTLITAFKVRHAVDRARHHLAAGRSVIVTMQTTGEAAEERRRVSGHEGGTLGAALLDAIPAANRAAASDELQRFAQRLPAEPMQRLRDELQQLGPLVELSGRKCTGGVSGRAAAVRAFQCGDAHIAIVTAAASLGISLHATGENGGAARQRAHILLELPWSPESFAQQCGRSCRAGQRTRPLYEVLVSDVPAETRFTSIVSSRLQSLGALTRGSRRTAYAGATALEAHSANVQLACAHTATRVLMCRAVHAAAARRFGPRYAAHAAAAHASGLAATTTRAIRAASTWSAGPAQTATLRQLRRQHDDLGTLMQYIWWGGGLAAAADDVLMAAAALLPTAESTGAMPAQRCFDPNGSTAVPSRWTPELHAQQPPPVRRLVTTLLLCEMRGRAHGAPPAAGRLVQLPRDVLLLIVAALVAANASPYDDDDSVMRAYEAMVGNLTAGPAQLAGTTSIKRLLNMTLTMPLQTQRVVHNTLALTTAQRRAKLAGGRHGARVGGARTLADYLLGVNADCMRLGVQCSPKVDGKQRLVARASYCGRPPDPREWSAEALCAVGRTRTGAPFAALRSGDTHELWYAGRVRPSAKAPGMHAAIAQTRYEEGGELRSVPRGQAGARMLREFVETHWAKAAASYVALMHRKAARLSRELEVTTERAMELWDSSLQQVLRCEEPRMTCLLLSVSRP